jgi:2-methylcitrate dehydratase PrpD
VSAAHRAALLDWMACAAGGSEQRAARAARAAGDGLLERVAWLGTAGHVLDFDDTYLPGVAHLSVPTAPAAIAVGAARGASVGDVLTAYAAGFEAMGALSRASHPALYDGGWHPTAVCGAAGAATAAGRLLGLDSAALDSAQRLALLQAGGMRAAFGSDGKAMQVGMAAAAGVHTALAAQGGAEVARDVVQVPGGFAQAFGGRWAEPDPDDPAIAANWIKPWPCCLMAHSSIEAALRVGPPPAGRIEVVVHPRARQAAGYDDVSDGLQAKFSIPYLVAFALLRGEPAPASFDAVDPAVRAFAAERVSVRADDALGESAARVLGVEVAFSPGSPRFPLPPERLEAKVRGLANGRLDGLLDDPARPAGDLLAALSASRRRPTA